MKDCSSNPITPKRRTKSSNQSAVQQKYITIHTRIQTRYMNGNSNYVKKILYPIYITNAITLFYFLILFIF